jgi:16S rRNA (uracil1498-N3)-methyltransferase
MDGVISQATEMGVKKIMPFLSSRSERLTLERAARRRAKWERLAQESLKSCQRSYLPEIAPVQEFAGVLPGPEEVKLLFWEEERGGGISKYFSRTRPAGVRLLIGPEGGFSPEEVALARERGYQIASLGPRRLKVETAALAALTLIQHAWGDLA